MRTLLLDLDGTLTDPFEGVSRALDHAMSGLGLAPLTEAQHRSCIGPPLPDSFSALGVPAGRVDEAITRYREYFADQGLLENRMYDGIPEALAELRSRGIRLAVATSKPEPFAVQVIEHFGLDVHLDHVSGSTLDGRVGTKAAVISLALDRLGEPDPRDVTMVGDRRHDVHGAAEHGIRCLGVRWGYAEPGELEGAGAYAVAEQPGDLVTLLG
ncbi:HAD hydrolase-like protein [Actinotalea sp.]|uniref:HAD hydrolase-like protein n=1 Tax=Actinotalea sp. TaxID=1872145 RepID=UPI003568B266